jgi:MFS family permease
MESAHKESENFDYLGVKSLDGAISDAGDLALPRVANILASGHYRNAVYMSLCFFMIFFGFLTIQNFQTTLPDPELALIGAKALIILYVTFTIVCLFCGEIVDRLGLKRSMIVSVLTYVLYCTYNLAPSAGFAYFAALLNGIGSAMLWTCNGAWLSLLIEQFEGVGRFVGGSSAGFFNGSFFAIYQLSQVAGNLLAALMFSSNSSVYTVLSTMTTMCAIGAGMMFFLKEPKVASKTISTFTAVDYKKNVIILQRLKLLLKKEFALLIPAIYATGVGQAFYFLALPAVVPEIVERFFVLAIFSFSDFFFNIILGIVSDKISRKYVIAIGALAHYIGYGLIINLGDYSYFESVIAAILLGVGDAAFNCQLYSIVAVFFQDEPTSAFSDYQVIIAARNASPCIYYLLVTIPGQSIIYLVLMTLGLIGLIWCNFFVKKIDVPKNNSIAAAGQASPITESNP